MLSALIPWATTAPTRPPCSAVTPTYPTSGRAQPLRCPVSNPHTPVRPPCTGPRRAATAGNGSGGGAAAPGGPANGSSSTNGSSGEPLPASASNNGGNGSGSGTGSGNGGGGNGSSGGGRPGSSGSGQPPNGDGSNGSSGRQQQQRQPPFKLPLSSQELSYAVLGLAALSGALLLAALQQAGTVAAMNRALETVITSLAGMADGPSTRDSVASLKRLMREVFAEQLTIKQRLSDAEKAASAAGQLEAADDYQLRQAQGGSSSWVRAPVRMSGAITAAGVLPWSQEASSSSALSLLSSLGVAAAANAVLQLHSVLAGGKRRITAEFRQAAHDGAAAAAALQLSTLLFRVQLRESLKLMIAPLGGGLEALGRRLTPVRGDYGCSQAVRQGHGLTVLQQLGSGKAVSLSSKSFLAAAGMFVSDHGTTGVAHLQARSQGGHSLSLVAAHSKPAAAGSTGASSSSSTSGINGSTGSSGRPQRWRFLGVQSPQHSSSGSSSTECSHEVLSGQVLGAAGVLPLTDACTATAWVEAPLSGQAGWGAGLFCQPDNDGVEVAAAVGRPSCPHTQAPRALFCELSAKVPAGDGFSISPCAIFTHRAGASSLAYVMQSCWRW